MGQCYECIHMTHDVMGNARCALKGEATKQYYYACKDFEFTSIKKGEQTMDYINKKMSNAAYKRIENQAREKGTTKYEIIHQECDALIRGMKTKMTFHEFCERRFKMTRRCSIVQDLLDDMKRDPELKGMTAQEIVYHIRYRNHCCDGCYEALKRLVAQYIQYCKRNNLEREPISTNFR